VKKILIVPFCLLPLLTFSQEIEWQNTIGGNAEDELFSIQQTSDGGYILGGYSNSDISGDKTENSNGVSDYWIVKTDSIGTIQWQNTIGGNAEDELFSIQQTSDGGYILGGQSDSDISGDKTENSLGYYDYWIVKTDSMGIIQWENTIGGSGTDRLNSLQQTSDGGYILGGYSNSNISGDKTEHSNGVSDYWIVKTDSIGNIQWQNTIGGNGDDELFSIQQTSDGGYILGGESPSAISGDKTENSLGFSDYWIVKTDSIGTIQWQNTIGGNNEDHLYTLQQTTDGGYILGGRSWSDISGDKSENSNGGFDYWIVKTDSIGTIQWQNTIGGNQYDLLYAIQQTSDGGYILGGNSNSDISGDKTENNLGYYDYWIVKTDSIGTIQWQNTIGGISWDYFRSIYQTADGGYFLGGFSESNISTDKTENSNGVRDYWIVKVNNQYNIFTGKLFFDSNNNGMQETGEPAVMNNQITEAVSGRFGFSGQNGQYYVTVLDSGNYSVSPVAINYYTPVPLTHNAYFSAIQLTDSLNDFAFQPTGVFNDLCASITPIGNFRAGFDASYMINYENVGTTTLSPTIIFFPDNDVSFVSSNVNPTSVTTDSVVWVLGPLTPFQSGSILVTVNINVGIPIGTLINSWVRIEPLAGDANTNCNISYWEIFTTGSVDPNDILVDEDTLFTTQFPNPPLLEYIIRFQNTGNDTAFIVKVLNLIDTFNLQLNTFEFVASSHPVNINWIPWERNMEFKFDTILLPDSNVNEPLSHGFIRYRIQPKSTLVFGDSITNNAAIYFDFNNPVLTNTAVTEIVLPTSSNEYFNYNMLLHPNPSSGEINISEKFIGYEMIIYDLMGRIIYNIPALQSSKVNLEFLSKGCFVINLSKEEKVFRAKLVLQ
jgi:hypothetical protein